MSAEKFQNIVKGALTENAPLGAQSWFRCGGTADLLFEPVDAEDLAQLLSIYPHDQELIILGGMANSIIRDGGVRGVVVRLGKGFSDISVMDECYVSAGAGALNGSVAAAAARAGVGGLEFLSGIPGRVGGALAMNAGAYGAEMKDILIGVSAVDRAGKMHRLTRDKLDMSYRHTDLPAGMVVTNVVLKGQMEERDLVKMRLKEIKKKRQDTQPIAEHTGGSTFANPSDVELRIAGLPAGTRAWEIVEKVGGRGMRIGGAQMSEKHCNFMINTGDATASDLEMLGDELIKRAYQEFGLKLRWEIKRIGESA